MRIRSIDALRGIAAIAVVFRHFSYPHADTRDLGHYGSYGVQIFFVISGFILPYSLYKSHYNLSDFWRFLLKRVIRLDPPYLVAGAFAILLAILNGKELISGASIAAHFGYLNDILGLTWASGVFWTLALEFQFYIFLALTYNILIKPKNGMTLFLGLIFFSSLALRNPVILPHWLPFFSFGILLHKYKSREISTIYFWISMSLMLCLAGYLHEIPALIAAVFGVIFILFIDIRVKDKYNSGLLWLGMISYSLYLTHNEWGKIALRIIRMVRPDGASALVTVAFQVIFALTCSYVFYLLFEKPFQRISSKIKYLRKETM